MLTGRRLPGPRERNRVVIALALGFFAGCRLAQALETSAWLLLAAALCVPLALLTRRAGRTLALALCALAVGAYSAGRALAPAAPDEGRYEATGYVCGGATDRDGERLTFMLCDIALDGRPVEGRAYCSYYYEGEPPTLFDGAAVRLTGRVYHPRGKSGAPHFDFRLWLYQNGMSFGITASKELLVENAPETAPARDLAFRARTACGDALARVMGDGSRLAMAMLFSDRDGLTDEENEAFRTLGVAHVLSVSGLHVAALGGLLLWLMAFARVKRSWRAPAMAALLLGYCALAGFSAASLRATVTLTLALAARQLGRKPDPLTTICASMLVVLALNPLQAYAAGFLLSYSAVAGIALAYAPALAALERLRTRGARWRARFGAKHGKTRGLGARLRQALALSIAAQAGVLMPTAVFFNRLPLYGVLVNVLIVPLTTLAVYLFAVTLLFSPVPVVGAALGWAANGLGRTLLWAVGLLSRLPYASVRVATAPAAVIGAFALCVYLLSRRARGSVRRRLLAGALCAVIGLAGAYAARPADPRYIQLDVGQADAALLMDGDATIAIDVGDDGTPVADYLLSENRDIDALILTHLHYDHAGGVRQLLEAGIRVRRAYLPVNAERQRVDPRTADALRLLRDAGVPIAELARGDELRFRRVTLRALWPVRENARAGQEANELPLVLAADFGGHTILCGSDLTGTYERYAAQGAQVLKVAHHGSNGSTGDDFLAAVAPGLAIISCSSSSASLPGDALLARLCERAIPYFRTDEAGDITLTLAGDRLVATPYKERTDP